MNRRAWGRKIEERWDALVLKLAGVHDIVSEKAADIYYALSEKLAGVIGKGLVSVPNSLVASSSKSKSRLLNWCTRLIGILLLTLFTVFNQIIISGLALAANLFGLRRGREYTFKENLLSWLPLMLFAMIFPFTRSEEFGIGQVTLSLGNAIIVAGLHMLYISGQASIGHGAFVIIGSYCSTILQSGLFENASWGIVLSVFGGGLAAMCAGFIVGLPATKVKGPYLSLLTLGLMISLPQLLKSKYLKSITGGADGLLFTPAPPPQFLGTISKFTWLYFHALLFFVILFISAYVMFRRSKFGRAMMIIKEAEERGNVLGINVVGYKMLCFGLSAFYAGIGGGIVSTQIGFISPESITVRESMDYLVVLVVGSSDTLFGAAIGGVILTYQTFLTEALSQLIPNGEKLLWGVYGVALISIIIFAPKGLIGSITSWLFGKSQRLPLRRAHRRRTLPDYDYEEELLAIGASVGAHSHIKVEKSGQVPEVAP